MRQRAAWRRALVPLAVFACATAAFFPALTAGFVDWDDEANFLAHDAWRGLGPAQLAWMATSFHLGPYQPLSWLTLGLDYQLFGLDARGFHATNVLIHGLAAVALYYLARRLLTLARGGTAAELDLDL